MRLPNVRRQLLEYKLVYQPDGILLLDMEHHNLQEIRFAYGAQRRKKWLRITLLILALGSLIWCLWQLFSIGDEPKSPHVPYFFAAHRLHR